MSRNMDLQQDPRRWLMLPIVLSATFMYAFDFNVVNVALPTLHRDLHASPVALELVVGGYAFTYAAGLVTGGRLGDLFGYRRMFLTGMAAFTAASVLCGLSDSPGQLVAARLLQGLTAAIMVPQVLAIITATFIPSERTRALAWFGVTGAVSGVVGQVLGGLILGANVAGVGWRAIFFVNLPVGLVVLAIARHLLARSSSDRRPSLDPIGVIGISCALALALVPLTLGHSEGWPAWTWIALVASVPSMTVALGYERRLARRGGDPLVDLALFHSRAYSAGLGIAVAFMTFFISSFFFMSLLLQSGLGLTPLQSGLTFGPACPAGVLAALAGRKLISRFGAPAIIRIGCGISAVGTIMLGVPLGLCGGSVPVGWLAGGLGIAGAGNSLILTAYLGATLSAVRPDQAGIASGTLNTVQQFAASAGLAVIGAVFFAFLGNHPGPRQYAHATEAVEWIGLGLMITMAALTTLLPRTVVPTAVNTANRSRSAHRTPMAWLTPDQ
jgi:EmrB/QacA subfamily drug resistance transporter